VSRRGGPSWSSRPAREKPTKSRSPKRELEEEAGLGGGDWRLAATFFSTPGFCDEVVRLYFAAGVEETARAPQEDEEIELVRVPVKELESLLPEIEDAKTLAGLLLYLRER
jgi:ADP-ribose pyrophosphatase